MKNGILILAALIAAPVWANTFMDDARDMLRSEREDMENQNADAVSRWGQSVRSKNYEEVRRVTVTAPISNDSFETSNGRAPASVSARGPAALPEMQPAPQKLDTSLPPRALVREAQRKKAHQEAALIATDQGFFPSTVFVTQGIPVRLFVTGASNKSQCFVMDSFGVRRQIKSQRMEEISFVPETSGTYTFTCPMNGARGQVVVREIDVGARVPASAEVSQAQ